MDPRLSWSLRVGLEDFIYNLAASSLCFLLRLQPGCEKLPQVPAHDQEPGRSHAIPYDRGPIETLSLVRAPVRQSVTEMRILRGTYTF